MNIKGVGVVVNIIGTDTFLIGKRANEGTWGFPGGKVEPEDESLAHAASRELEEEFGLKIPPEMFIYIGKSYSPINPLKLESSEGFSENFMIGLSESYLDEIVLDPREVESATLMTIQEMIALEDELYPSTKYTIKRLLEQMIEDMQGILETI